MDGEGEGVKLANLALTRNNTRLQVARATRTAKKKKGPGVITLHRQGKQGGIRIDRTGGLRG